MKVLSRFSAYSSRLIQASANSAISSLLRFSCDLQALALRRPSMMPPSLKRYGRIAQRQPTKVSGLAVVGSSGKLLRSSCNTWPSLSMLSCSSRDAMKAVSSSLIWPWLTGVSALSSSAYLRSHTQASANYAILYSIPSSFELRSPIPGAEKAINGAPLAETF